MTDASFDPRWYIESYHSRVQKDDKDNQYPRLLAWEFIYEYIWREGRSWKGLVDTNNLDTTSLHIGLYLANWGMYRGSSQLLRNSNLDLLRDLSKRLFIGKGPELFELSGDDFLSKLSDGNKNPKLTENQKLFDDVIAEIRLPLGGLSWTDTLVSKILLGVWGEYPALDTFFIAGVRNVRPRSNMTSLSGKSLTAMMDYMAAVDAAAKEEGEASPFPQIRTQDLKLEYPKGKLLDMAFFEYGSGL